MIRLTKTTRGKAILETTDRYDVTVNGKLIGQLYWNMTGYTGVNLPLPCGSSLHVGECGIGKWKAEVARVNREWKAQKPTTAALPECTDGDINHLFGNKQ